MTYTEGFINTSKDLKRVFYRSWSPPEPSAQVVCLHGAGGNSADFTFLAERLSHPARAVPYKVIAFDAPGSGYSEPNSTVPPFAVKLKVLSAILKKSTLRIGLLTSSGGAIASLACLYQNRDDEKFKTIPLALAEPAFGFDEETRSYIKECQVFLGKAFLNLESAEMAWDNSPLRALVFDDNETKRRFIRGRLRPRNGALQPALRPVNPESLKEFNILAGKESLPNPTLAMWGEQSRLRKLFAEQMGASLPNSEEKVFTMAGHPLSLSCNIEAKAIEEFFDKQFIGE
ncbi:MAG: alpha/beta hydrolase [Rhodocyclaceae bacterium]|nr:alpha/beta hydrolase [Rhodocyclaceae bacterium]